MSMSKIEISVGSFKFTGEGEQKWLSEQLDKIIKESSKLIKLEVIPENRVNPVSHSDNQNNNPKTSSSVTLAKLLKDFNATSSQNKKFLGAAVYLSLKGNSSLKTGDITKALRDAGQTRIGNPSACLAENIKKGYLEKTGSDFMVTMHGKEQFGIDE